MEGLNTIGPPTARVIQNVLTAHDDTRTDDYFWLRERSDPEVIAYLEAENAYTEAVMNPTREMRERLYDEMLGRINQTDLSVPYRKKSYYYYSRTEEGKQYSIHCRKPAGPDGAFDPEAAEQIILDENALAEGHSYFRLAAMRLTPDQRLLAYAAETSGDERFTLRIVNLETGELFPESIQGTSGNIAWGNDGATLFYITLDDARRPFKLFRHRLGDDPTGDEMVFHEEDEAYILSVHTSRSERFILLGSHSQITSEVRVLSADEPEGAFRVLQPRVNGVEYGAAHHGEFFYLVTNDDAVNFRLVRTPVDAPGKENWVEIIPHRADTRILDVDEFKDVLMVMERHRGTTRFRVLGLEDGSDYYIEHPETVYTVIPERNVEFDTETYRFLYTSLVTPMSVYSFDFRTRNSELLKRTEVLGEFDPSLYHTERLFAKAPDGVEVPVSLVHRRDIRLDGGNPALLYGYGSYGHSIDPIFSSNILSLLDRGFVYAIAHIRGGEEMGRAWYEQGKFLNKKNTFTDFISSAEMLIERGYTSPSRLSIKGGSAGGLLMGAVINMRPDLFASVIANVPFVDVVNTMSDPSLPLTVGEYEEWGNPGDKVFYEYIRSYSPYDNVAAQEYPNILVTAGLNDPRVSYWEPAKWVAKLRVLKTDDNLLLLKTDMGAGHGGPSGRYDYLRDLAFEYAFLLLTLGVPA